MKKIIAIILTILTIFSLTACGGKDTKGNSAVDELDKMVKDELGDMVLHTEYDDGIYYVFISVEDVSSTFTFKAYGFDNAFDGLSETIYETKGMENAIIVLAYNNTDNVLYTTYNGNDITDYMQ